MDELKWESFLKASEIGVAVSDGVVTLSGFVDSYFKKKAAENAVLRVAGVKAVAEDIEVKVSYSDKKTDTEIAQAISNALKWHSAVKEDKIKVKVDNGWVTLEGVVDWSFERDAIRVAVENLVGVKGISNLIRLSEKVSINDVKRKINAAFHRNATLDANKIIVENVGNKVYLKGTVRSIAEKLDAERAAWNAPGVTTIENKLEVDVPVFINEDL